MYRYMVSCVLFAFVIVFVCNYTRDLCVNHNPLAEKHRLSKCNGSFKMNAVHCFWSRERLEEKLYKINNTFNRFNGIIMIVFSSSPVYQQKQWWSAVSASQSKNSDAWNEHDVPSGLCEWMLAFLYLCLRTFILEFLRLNECNFTEADIESLEHLFYSCKISK